MTTPRIALLFALLLGLGLPLAARPAAEAATDATVVVAVHRGKDAQRFTGTLVHATDREAVVFAVLSSSMRTALRGQGAKDVQVGFLATERLDMQPVEEVIWHHTRAWALLRFAGKPPCAAPPLRVLGEGDVGLAVTMGGHAVDRETLNGRLVSTTSAGTIASFQAARQDAAPIPVTTLGVVPRSSGAPLVDPDGRLVGVADAQIPGTDTSRAIPVLTIWEFMWQQLPPLEFSTAKEGRAGWAMRCRSNLPLLSDGAAVGIAARSTAKQRQVHGNELPDATWVAFGGGGQASCLLPVPPPDVGQRVFAVQLRQKLADDTALLHGPVHVAINYTFGSPARTPWIKPEGRR